MGWTTPPSFTPGQILTASEQNILSGDLSFLAGAQFASVNATDTTSNTSYGNLSTTNGPYVNVVTGANAIVMLTASASNSQAGFNGSLMGFEVGGASSILPSVDQSLLILTSIANVGFTASAIFGVSGLTPGSNSFSAQYAVYGSGGGTSTYSYRNIIVIPLP